jgi:hypothetical protein
MPKYVQLLGKRLHDFQLEDNRRESLSRWYYSALLHQWRYYSVLLGVRFP